MTVFIAHAPADLDAAEALERYVERRGQFVELDDGQTALRPVEGPDVVVLLMSQNLVDAPTRLRLEQRAFDAWRQQRLVLIKLDDSPAPVGLRDLEAFNAIGDGRDAGWGQAADAVAALLKAAAAMTPAAPVENEPAAPGGGVWRLLLWLAAAPGLLALAAVASIWLVNRIGPTPGGWRELSQGVDAFGVTRGLPSGVTGWLFAAAILVTVLIIGRAIVLLALRASRKAKPDGTTAPPSAPPAAMLLCATADRARVEALVAGAASFAQAPADAERGEPLLAVCSAAAFDDDAFKRGLYAADRIGKRPVPVYIDEVEAPEDFAYFFAGAEPLNLFALAEAERPQALQRALGQSS